MDALLGVAAVVTVGAITPGPNNWVVMRAAARSGAAGALPIIAGVVLGSLALLVLVAVGGGAVFEAEPRLQAALAIGGSLYLGGFGARLVLQTFSTRPRTGPDAERLPSGLLGLFGFQFLNPKSWVMVLTATAAAQNGSGAQPTFLRLAGLFVLIPAGCLVVWSTFGSLMSRVLERPAIRPWIDRAMGLLLVGSAFLLLAETWGMRANR
jgi:threonine/homoserine/homoserine lactone efflux protein